MLAEMFVPGISDVSFIDLLHGDGRTERVAIKYSGPEGDEIGRHMADYPPLRDGSSYPPARALFRGESVLIPVVDDELTDGVEIYGFIEDGVAEEHVVPKERLTAFFRGNAILDESDTEAGPTNP